MLMISTRQLICQSSIKYHFWMGYSQLCPMIICSLCSMPRMGFTRSNWMTKVPTLQHSGHHMDDINIYEWHLIFHLLLRKFKDDCMWYAKTCLHDVTVISDDILVYGCGFTEKCRQDYNANLEWLLQSARDTKLKLNRLVSYVNIVSFSISCHREPTTSARKRERYLTQSSNHSTPFLSMGWGISIMPFTFAESGLTLSAVSQCTKLMYHKRY